MNVIDIHAHIYERVAGITRGQPMASTGLGRVAIGNEEGGNAHRLYGLVRYRKGGSYA